MDSIKQSQTKILEDDIRYLSNQIGEKSRDIVSGVIRIKEINEIIDKKYQEIKQLEAIRYAKQKEIQDLKGE